jgi:hypothetical protein
MHGEKMKKNRYGKRLKDMLLTTYGVAFEKLYMSGVSATSAAKILGIPNGMENSFVLRKLLNLPVERWRVLGMPETFDNELIGLIYGTLLGDASINKEPSSPNRKVFTIGHSVKQKEYIEHKRHLLSLIKPHEIKEQTSKFGKWLRFMIAPHPIFKTIYDEFYSTGTKQASMMVLNKLTPQGIALWYMDDGTTARNSFTLCTDSFDRQSIANIIIYFRDKYQINGVIRHSYKESTNKDYYHITFYSKNAVAFKNLISPYIIPSMQYKLLISDGTGTKTKWSTDELILLEKEFTSYSDYDLNIIADQLPDRTPTSIKAKVSRMRQRANKSK